MGTFVLCGCILSTVIVCMIIRECIDAFGRWLWGK